MLSLGTARAVDRLVGDIGPNDGVTSSRRQPHSVTVTSAECCAAASLDRAPVAAGVAS